MNYRELLLGCGHKHDKRIVPDSRHPVWRNLTTIDINIDCKPDVYCDLDTWELYDVPPATFANPVEIVDAPYIWPLEDVDEIHAYEVLEHLGTQGDYKAFFNFMSFAWRLLKNGGFFCATVPSRFSPWFWGDPGHRRAILPDTLVFLNQPQYTIQCGRTAMSDYRSVYRADFDIVSTVDDRMTHAFILRAVKPSRISI